jgi:hypothetical protein
MSRPKIILVLMFLFQFSASAAPFDQIEFGIATAPAQVEDGLDDIWSDWANQGKIAGFK